MKVEKVRDAEKGTPSFRLLDEAGRTVEEVEGFLRYHVARASSPNTVEAYAYDLLHFYRFLSEKGLGLEDFTPGLSLQFFEYLRKTPSRNGRARRLSPALVADGGGVQDGRPVTLLAPTSVNRTMACVSSFYEHLVLLGDHPGSRNPVSKVRDGALARVPERPKPFLEGVHRRAPARRLTRAKTIVGLPRPMDDVQVRALVGSLKKLRDKAMVLLMVQGGLRPGEVLCLKLEDVQYGKRRVFVRFREDHPKGARTKSRTERVVDLHESETLATLSAYVMRERPRDAESPFVFLVGGKGRRRSEPLSYWALVKLFERRCDALGLREPWITPHALRHTHATEMWEGGMQELALQKRLGHASPESTRAYTRVSDQQVVEEYRRALGDNSSKESGP